MADFLLFSNSTDGMALEPDYSFAQKGKLITSQLRTQDGGLKIYKYGEFAAFEVPVTYITTSDQLQINKWWSAVTDLKFVWQGSEYNVRVMNKNQPIDKVIVPYNNLYQGTIELEGF